MIHLTILDTLILFLFFLTIVLIGFYFSRNTKSANDYLLSGRNVGMLLFILTNVATWYGGILGVGEFTYRYGIVSWVTQGLPYYFFAILFAFFLAPKIRRVSLFTIPEKLTIDYGNFVGKIAAVLILILVSPAPYLLMFAYLISLIFKIKLIYSLIIGVVLSTIYLYKGGYNSNIYTDAFQFLVMFVGFIILLIVSVSELGGGSYLVNSLPPEHLSLSGGNSPMFMLVWFLIASWTFTDPGFHQRCYSAKNTQVAKYGILISVILWALFDFLTTSTGLFARAYLGEISSPIKSFPLFADKMLSSGLKGFFFAALFATILSTLNSFMFLSATTFGRDLLKRENDNGKSSINKTRFGLLVSSIFAVLLAYYFNSVVDMWYTIGSVCIPGLLLLIIGAYFPKFKISNKFAQFEILCGIIFSVAWIPIRKLFPPESYLALIEPMVVGLIIVLSIHLVGIKKAAHSGQ